MWSKPNPPLPVTIIKPTIILVLVFPTVSANKVMSIHRSLGIMLHPGQCFRINHFVTKLSKQNCSRTAFTWFSISLFIELHSLGPRVGPEPCKQCDIRFKK